MLALPPLSLYVHIPWCERKCPYCDFNSHVNDEPLPETDYIEQLLQDLQQQQAWIQGRKLQSIFIGGGTPSLFSAESIQYFLQQAARMLPFADDIEITMEANPGSSEQQKFSALYQAGVNRLSLGIQSFADEQLQALGRVHNSLDAHNAIKAAQQAGFQRINLDLMHGLPKQDADKALADLQQAIDSGVSHISWYQLTIEQNTAFYRYPPVLPEEEVLADIQEAGFAQLRRAGFQQYEVSAFCQDDQQARHNLNYWQFGDYLAVGAGAHGKITLPDENRILRFNNTRLPKDYLQRVSGFVANQTEVTEDERLFEALMNCLRLREGMPVESLLERTGSNQQTLLNLCQPLIDRQLLVINQQIRTTDLGFRFLNTVLQQLLD